MKYEECINLFQHARLKTRAVQVGGVYIGGENPVRIQSMTNTNTLDTDFTVNQSLSIVEAGGELVRITAQGRSEVENLKNIKNKLQDKNMQAPIVADIHFNPELAFIASEIVEKVRINPGNFVDKGIVAQELTEEEFISGVRNLEDKFTQLIDLCKKNKTALRIGVNHGSLSGRILSRYGDTPQGMVESAMEFLRVCLKEDFLNVVVSLKSSNTRVMIYANRLLVMKMQEEGMNFPLHLGVTEAGEGEDGRIKSAVGIGTLLADGIGDTIRVSLTEPPEDEIPVAKKIVDYFAQRETHELIKVVNPVKLDFCSYTKRESSEINNIGGANVPVVISNNEGDNDLKPDYIYLGEKIIVKKLNPELEYIVDEKIWEQQIFETDTVYPLFPSINNYYLSDKKSSQLNFVTVKASDINGDTISKIKNAKDLVLILETNNKNGFGDQRAAFLKLINYDCKIPVIVKRSYNELVLEDLQLKSACDIGGLFIDGLGDGIWINNSEEMDSQSVLNTSFGILQASRARFSKTEYISCPGCGRTLFDLQKATQEIRKRTSHLKNLKIGIMGCIVNGPGEMADADYGYVGSAPGKITLYKNKEVVKKNILEKDAVEELIQLIKKNGNWAE